MKLIIIIPAYNEEKTIIKVIKKIPLRIKGVDIAKIAVINDGSTDNTVKKVELTTNAEIISHSQNKGLGAAFRTGVGYALREKADLMVNIDADGQFNPLDIAQLIQPILNNQADFVSASRFIKKDFIPDMPAVKLWGNRGVSLLISYLVGIKFYDVSCGFRAYNKEALLNLNLFGQFTYTQETFLDLAFKGLKIKEIPLRVQYFSERKSKIYRGAFHYAINILKIIFKTARDYQPLKFFGGIGLSVFLLGLILDVFMFVFFIQTGVFTPYKWIGLLGIFLNTIGLILLVLALVADMLYRIRVNQEKMIYNQKKQEYYK